VDTAQLLILRLVAPVVLEVVQVAVVALCIAEGLQQPAQHKGIMAVVMEIQAIHTHLVAAAAQVL
jgi:hypothetical protein